MGDGALTMFIAGHWSNLGSAPGWNELGIFFPAPDTLGYSDTLFLYGVAEVPMQLLGINPNYLFQFALILGSAAGYASCVAFLRMGPRAPWPVAIAGSLVIVFSNGLALGSIHPQLLTIQLVPVAALFSLLTWRARSRLAQALWGIAAGAAVGLILYSAFYIGWFLLIALVLGIPLTWLVRRFVHLRPIPWRELVMRAWPPVVGFAITLVPFVLTYLPILRQGTADKSLDVVADFALSVRQLFGVSGENFLWGNAAGALIPQDQLNVIETSMAPTYFLLLTASAAGIWGLVRLRQLNAWAIVGLVSVAIGLFMWIIPLNDGGLFLWKYTLYNVPGGVAIRSIGRIELMASLLLAFGLALLLTEFLKLKSKRSKSLLAVLGLGLVLLVGEQINVITSQQLDVARLDVLQAIAVPEACKSFVITTPSVASNPSYLSQTEAATISRANSVPTWNGYSGGVPPQWKPFWGREPGTPSYRAAVLEWGTVNDLFDTSCGLDLANKRWMSPAELLTWAKTGRS